MWLWHAHDPPIGGGLAGSEAAWQLAEAGIKVRLSELRGTGEMTPAHHTDGLAELVCSNGVRCGKTILFGIRCLSY